MGRVIAILISIFSMATSAEGLVGDVSAWKGHYEVMSCSSCPDVPTKSGANLKNLLWFGLNTGPIDPLELEPCAQIKNWIGFAFAVKADDSNLTSMFTDTTGLCDWGSNEVLSAGPFDFSYENRGANSRGRKVSLSLHRVGLDTYEWIRHESSIKPPWGFPQDFEYRAIVRKRPN